MPDQPQRGSYTEAVGAMEGMPLRMSPEEAIRRVRDGQPQERGGATVDQFGALPFDLERAAIGWRLAKAGDEQDAANWAYEHLDAVLSYADAQQAQLATLTAERVELEEHFQDAWAETEKEKDSLKAAIDTLTAENEALERKMKAHRETAVAAIAGSDKQVHALTADLARLTQLHDEGVAAAVADTQRILDLERELTTERDQARAQCEQVETAWKSDLASADSVMVSLRAENERLRQTLARSDSDEMALLSVENQNLLAVVEAGRKVTRSVAGPKDAIRFEELVALRTALAALDQQAQPKTSQEAI